MPKHNFNACLKNDVFTLESDVGDEFPELCNFLQNNQDEITSVTIAHNDLMDKSKVLLLSGIFANILRLTTLKLNDNSISDEAARYIAMLLESNTKLNSVDLSNNNIHDKGAIAIVHALAAQTDIELNLMMNNIGDNAAKTIARIFGGSKHSVGLDMQLCNLTNACGQDLQEALKNNPNFRVNIYLNEMDNDIVKKIDMISRNNAITLADVEQASKPSASTSASAGIFSTGETRKNSIRLTDVENASKPSATAKSESAGIFMETLSLKGRLGAHRKNVENGTEKEKDQVDHTHKRNR
jgi:Leucine-rich repeat (LRR) protein